MESRDWLSGPFFQDNRSDISGMQTPMGLTGMSYWFIITLSYIDRSRYHSHDKSTIQDGLYGAIHIRSVYLPSVYNPNSRWFRYRPSPNRQNPFAAISKNDEDQRAMKEAERNPVSVVLSDWDHLTSEDYMKALEDTGYDILYAPAWSLLANHC